MPTNANTFNSRVTSEALEAKFRQVFPAQGGAELVQDLFASGVIQPVIDFSSVAEGSVLGTNLQTALDFATTRKTAAGSTQTVTSTPGFWLLGIAISKTGTGNSGQMKVNLSDGITSKNIIDQNCYGDQLDFEFYREITVFVRSGDTLSVQSTNGDTVVDFYYRQIADVNGNLVNPLGFVFQ